MRQDPDVILVGEMRDTETVSAALSAAETGHLVLSTLHTIDTPETINRIVDFYPPHQHGQVRAALAGSLRGTVCQRLVPRADGHGRVAVLEVMVTTGRVQQCILDPQLSGDIQSIVAEGEYYGMQTFDQHLARLYEEGVIDWRSVTSAATNPHDLRLTLQLKGVAVAAR
jgi:twitching motility protein PilT